MLRYLSCVRLFATLQTAACQASQSMRFSICKNSGVGCHALLRGIFLTQRSNPGLLHCRRVPYHWATSKAHVMCMCVCVCVCIYTNSVGTRAPCIGNTGATREAPPILVLLSTANPWARFHCQYLQHNLRKWGNERGAHSREGLSVSCGFCASLFTFLQFCQLFPNSGRISTKVLSE